MPRPKKDRKINLKLRVKKFSPRGIIGRPDIVRMGIDEVEALKLAELDKLKHKDAAISMGISRQTFDRILKRAHFDLANAVVHGKILEISEKKE